MTAPRVVDVHGVSVRVTEDDVRRYAVLQQSALDYVLAFEAFGRWPDHRGRPAPPPDVDDSAGGSRVYVFGAQARRTALQVLAIRQLFRERDLEEFKRGLDAPNAPNGAGS